MRTGGRPRSRRDSTTARRPCPRPPHQRRRPPRRPGPPEPRPERVRGARTTRPAELSPDPRGNRRRHRILPAPLLNHSYRTYQFGRAIGELEGVDVDAELLYAAALLHDIGLVTADGRDDFTLTSARIARDVAENVGLSTAATETLQTAITMHHSPRVTLTAGPVAYLLSAGAGVDVAGVRCWQLPAATLTKVVRDHPRERFKKYFTQAWANESARVPHGRARLLRRYGAFTAAIALAPFDE